MADDILFKRGNLANVTPFQDGEPAITQDTRQVFVGQGGINIELQTKPRTSDFTVYCATAALGGDTNANGKTGRVLSSGTTDGTTTSKLVDSTASFTSALVGEAVYNSTNDTWAKVTAFDSATILSVSADIFVSGDGYEIASAVDNLIDAFNLADSSFQANITILVSAGTFTDTLEWIGKTAGAAKILTIKGSTTGTSTVAGEVTIRQKIFLSNLTFTKRIFEYFGADVDWTTCVTSGDDGFIITKSTSIANAFRTSSVIVFGNDPGAFANISSTVTIGYTIYVATPALGGDDTVADGLELASGTTTGTTASKLVDSGKTFDSSVLNKTVWNSTDDTWAKVTAIDSTTQLSLSADIMVSGDGYVISNAFSTVQSGFSAIPGNVNANTDIKISNGIFSENLILFGVSFSGQYIIKIKGSRSTIDSGTSTGGNTTTTFVDTSKTWGTNIHAEKLIEILSGTGVGQLRLIKSNTSNTLVPYQWWLTVPDNTSVYRIFSPATSGMGITVDQAQIGIEAYYIQFDNTSVLRNVWVNASSKLSLFGCTATGATESILRADDYSNLAADQTIAYSGGFCLFVNLSKVSFTGCLIRNMSSFGIYCLTETTITLWEGTEIRNNGNHGIYLNGNCTLFVIPTTTPGRQVTINNNSGWGIYMDTGTQGQGAAQASYTGNASGTYSADSSQFAFTT